MVVPLWIRPSWVARHGGYGAQQHDADDDDGTCMQPADGGEEESVGDGTRCLADGDVAGVGARCDGTQVPAVTMEGKKVDVANRVQTRMRTSMEHGKNKLPVAVLQQQWLLLGERRPLARLAEMPKCRPQ